MFSPYRLGHCQGAKGAEAALWPLPSSSEACYPRDPTTSSSSWQRCLLEVCNLAAPFPTIYPWTARARCSAVASVYLLSAVADRTSGIRWVGRLIVGSGRGFLSPSLKAAPLGPWSERSLPSADLQRFSSSRSCFPRWFFRDLAAWPRPFLQKNYQSGSKASPPTLSAESACCSGCVACFLWIAPSPWFSRARICKIIFASFSRGLETVVTASCLTRRECTCWNDSISF